MPAVVEFICQEKCQKCCSCVTKASHTVLRNSEAKTQYLTLCRKQPTDLTAHH